MTATTSPAPDDKINKRLKQVDDVPAPSGPQAAAPQEQVEPPQRYPPPPQSQHYNVSMQPSGPPHSHMAPGGYYGLPPPPSQYGSHGSPPPHHWQGGSQVPGHAPPPPGRYSSGPPPPQRGLSPDRMGGGPPWPHHGGYRDSSPPKGLKSKSKRDRNDDSYHYPHGPPIGYQGPPPPPGYGPPPHWQTGLPPPPPQPQPPMYTSQGTWTGKSPPRTGRSHHDQYRHEMDLPPYLANGQESVDDDCGSSTAESNREKGRGSYKCGRCGVPKKGHVCPYQPKLKRRPDEPLPQTRCAAVQVEMDEFMTLRRLNIRIQGFPESYATEPYMTAEATLAVSEAMHHPMGASIPPDMSTISHPPIDPQQHLSSNGVCLPIPEPPDVRDAGTGDEPIYGENGNTEV